MSTALQPHLEHDHGVEPAVIAANALGDLLDMHRDLHELGDTHREAQS